MRRDSLFYQLFAQLAETLFALLGIDNPVTFTALYNFTKLNREEVLRMLGFTTEELKQTRFYQEVYAEGREEELQQGEALVVLRLLRRRFGDLPADLEAVANSHPLRLRLWQRHSLALRPLTT